MAYLQGVYEPLCAKDKVTPKCELDSTRKFIGAFLGWLQDTYDNVPANAIPLDMAGNFRYHNWPG